MSTPFTAPLPDMPTGSSSPASVKGWFTKIGEWIRGMSPTGVTTYDTGWQNVTLKSGYVGGDSTPQVRRIGRAIYFKGQVLRTGSAVFASGAHTIASVPATMSPVSFSDYPRPLWPDGTAGGAVFGTVVQGGNIDIRIPTSAGSVQIVHLAGLGPYPIG